MDERRITCPHCRERLPNDVILTSQEANDALLDDPQFQRRIRAVSLNVRCLFFKRIQFYLTKHFFGKCRDSVYITTMEPFQHVVLRAMS